MAVRLTPEQAREALKLQRRCWTRQRIADHLGVTREAVSRCLSKLNRRAWERLEKRLAAEKAAQAERLDWVAEQAAEAWEQSRQPAETLNETTWETGPEKDGEKPKKRTKSATTVEGQVGDPRLLEQVRGALADQRKLLGLDAPKPPAAPPAETDWDAAVREIAEEHERYQPEQKPEPEGPDQGAAP